MSPPSARRFPAGALALPASRPVQLDLFPEKPLVERLDPRANVGPRTGVLVLVRVRMRASEAPHLVFHDRHGWYCETHGPACAAVALAREATA
jgi:hypothetical protein